MTVEWASDPRDFTARDWTELSLFDPEGTLFHTPRFLKLYWEEFGAGDLRLAFVRDGEDVVAAAAFEVRGGLLSFLGGTEVTDYMGPVGHHEARDGAAKELMAALATQEDWARADLRGLREEGSWLGALARGAADAGLAVEIGEDSVAPYVEVPDSFQGYLDRLSAKHRHELRRKLRRFHEAFPKTRLVDATPESFSDDLERFVELHRSSTGPKGKFMQPGMEIFFRRLGEAFLPDGTFRLAFLESGGEKLAGVVAFRDRGRLLLYNSAYDHARARLAPGIVLVAELIRDAIGRGCRAVDLLKGNLEYKYRFGARPRRIARLVLAR